MEMRMSLCLFADAEPERGLLSFAQDNWLLLTPPILGFVAIYLLLPQVRRTKPIWGGVLVALALTLGAFVFLHNETNTSADIIETLLFYAFAGIAIVAGVMMITQSNPVHAALSFALVVLSSCGLFLVQAAPFLMAATIIVYAGAIVVTFLFVIMLAQQEGPSNADQRSREPFLASLAGCVLMVSLLCILQRTYDTREIDEHITLFQKLSEAKDEKKVKELLGDPAMKKPLERTLEVAEKLKNKYPQEELIHASVDQLNLTWSNMQLNPLKKSAAKILVRLKEIRSEQGSLALRQVPGKPDHKTPSHFEPGKLPASNVAGLGRTLFTDYLIPVELAAALLLVATIGAIVIAGRRSEELR